MQNRVLNEKTNIRINITSDIEVSVYYLDKT